MNHKKRYVAAVIATAILSAAALNSAAQSPDQAKSATAMERTEHQWRGDGRSSTFGAYWMGAELKMIREEMDAGPDAIEKHEFFFNAGALQHYKLERDAKPGRTGSAISLMASFDKTGKTVISMKRIDGRPAGPSSPAEIEQAKKHLAELLAITSKVRR